MPDFSCEILGLHLQSPFILKSAKFSDKMEENLLPFIGALMLIPFPQEIIEEESSRIEFLMDKTDLLPYLTDKFLVDQYLKQVIELKQKYKLPVIAGIDCYDSGNFILFCQLLDKIKTDVLLLNIFMFPDDKDFRSADYDKIYLELAAKAAYSIEMPVIINLYLQFTNMFYMVDQLFYRGIQGFLLSDNIIGMDIDIENFEQKILLVSEKSSFDYNQIKWIAYLSSFFHKADFISYICGTEFTASTCIKHLLAGAKGLTISMNDLSKLNQILTEIENWMKINGFHALEHFVGQLNFQKFIRPWQAERENYLQFFHLDYQISDHKGQSDNC